MPAVFMPLPHNHHHHCGVGASTSTHQYGVVWSCVFSLAVHLAGIVLRASCDVSTQVYKLAPEGLQPVLDTDVYGRIAVLLSFRLPVR